MRFSPLVDRIYGKGAEAWALHSEALKQKRAGRKDVILLSVGDPDFNTPSVIVDRAVQALQNGDTHYSDIVGFPELRNAIAGYHTRITGQEVKMENVAVLAGAQSVLFASSMMLFSAGDEIIVPEPAYVTYEATIQASGARIVHVPTKAENNFHLDKESLARAISPKTRAIMFASPNNPTGAMMRPEDLEMIAALAKQHDLWVISDEVYATLAFDRPHLSIASLPGMGERSVTINSVSKSHAMTGWRLGWMVGPIELIKHAGKMGLAMLYGSPPFIQRGVTEALRLENAQIVEEMRKAYRHRRDYVAARLNQIPNIQCRVPEGGMFMMLDVRPSGLSSHDFSWRLFEKTGICTLDAAAFGPSSDGHLRMGLVVEDKILDEACTRIAAFAKEL